MLHVPYQGDGHIAPNMRDYVVKQLKETVIPTLERISGVKFDIDRLRQYMRESVKAEEDLVSVLQSAKNRPSPIDGYFRLGVTTSARSSPRFAAPRGDASTTRPCAARSSACASARARSRPTAMGEEKYRPRRRGPAELDQLPQFWKMFYDEGAVVVASTYAKVGGLYDYGFRHDPDRRSNRSPSTAWAATPT